MSRYQVSVRGSIIVRMNGPTHTATEFMPGAILPAPAVRIIEAGGDLRKLLAKGLIKEVGAPEMPRKTHGLVQDAAGNTSLVEGEVPLPDVKTPGGFREDPVPQKDQPTLATDPMAAAKESTGHTTGVPSCPWILNPNLLDQCNVAQLNAVIKDKDPQGPEFTQEQHDEAVKFLSQEWTPEDDDQRRIAVSKGFLPE